MKYTLELTGHELGILEEGLSELMSDEYGEDNEEGCWSEELWAELTALSSKLMHVRYLQQ